MIKVVHSLAELPQVNRIALVVNCSTRIFTTLAVASLYRFSNFPALIVDCESTDQSFEHFERVFAGIRRDVFIFSLPLRPHGKTLDDIFSLIRIPEVLVMDSDIEILERDILESMDEALQEDRTSYGSGLLQKGGWMTPPFHKYPPNVAWYNERMWIPLTLLRTARVVERLEAGDSFLASRDHDEIMGWPRLSRLLSHRFRMRSRSSSSESAEPKILEWDTGSKVHGAMKMVGRLSAIGDEYWASVHHAHGVTRSQRSSVFFRAAVSTGLISKSMLTDAHRAEIRAMKRLAQHYPEYI